MTATYTLTYTDTVNGEITDTFTMSDDDAVRFMAAYTAAMTPQPRGGQQRGFIPVVPTPQTVIHQIAAQVWNGVSGTVSNFYRQAAQQQAAAAVVEVKAIVAQKDVSVADLAAQAQAAPAS